MRSMVEGFFGRTNPSTALRAVPLPRNSGGGMKGMPPHGLTPISQARAPRAVCIRFSA
jgi:hypothetical protein